MRKTANNNTKKTVAKSKNSKAKEGGGKTKNKFLQLLKMKILRKKI